MARPSPLRTLVARGVCGSENVAAFIDLNGVTDEGDLHDVESVATVVDPVGNYDAALETVTALVRL